MIDFYHHFWCVIILIYSFGFESAV